MNAFLQRGLLNMGCSLGDGVCGVLGALNGGWEAVGALLEIEAFEYWVDRTGGRSGWRRAGGRACGRASGGRAVFYIKDSLTKVPTICSCEYRIAGTAFGGAPYEAMNRVTGVP